MIADLRAPAPADLLTAWEIGLQDAGARADAVLATVAAEVADPGRLPLGQRNRLLLAARSLLFGQVAEVVAPCASCEEPLEAEVSLDVLLAALANAPDEPRTVDVRSRGYYVCLRLPTAVDLAGLPADVAAAAGVLLARCVVEARHGDAQIGPERLPDGVVRAVDAALAAADPGANLELAATCPSCGAAGTLALDPVTLLWSELEAWGWRMLSEVHCLAGAYGWAEADVLAMSPTRRRAYLHLCGAGEGGA